MVPLAFVLGGMGLLLQWSAWFCCRKTGVKIYTPIIVFRLDSQLMRRGVWLYLIGCIMAVVGLVMLGVQLLFR